MKKLKAAAISAAALVVLGVIVGPVLLRQKKVLQVKTQAVERGGVQSWLSGTGTVVPEKMKEYYGPSQLKTLAVNIKPGDRVKKGEVLAAFDTYDLKTALSQAEIQLDSAKLQYDDLKSTAANVESNLNTVNSEISALRKSISSQSAAELQSLETQKMQLESQKVSSDKLAEMNDSVSLAQLAADSAQKKLDEASAGIVADFDGIVTAVNISAGSYTSAAQPSIEIADPSSLKVAVPLGKYDVIKVKAGQKAVIDGGSKFSGSVESVSPSASAASGVQSQSATVECDVSVQNPGGMLRINLQADVDILTGDVKDVLVVPIESVKTDKSGANYVFVLGNGRIKKVNVTLGVSSDVSCEVASGLSLGQKVILNPDDSVADGVKAAEAPQS